MTRLMLCLAAAAFATPGFAQGLGDITFGGDARSFAMGGAGIAALTAGTTAGVRNNPASLALTRNRVNLHAPSLGIRADGGVTLTKALDALVDQGSRSNATELARRFASQDSSFGLNGSVGVRAAGLEVMVSGVGLGRLLPNASLQNWAKTGGAGNVPGDARADLLAAGVYTLPSVGYAVTLPRVESKAAYDIAVGGRIKYLHAVYTHLIADSAALNSGNDAFRAPEMGTRDTLSHDGIGADLGLLLTSRQVRGLAAGLVVTNAVRPKLAFAGTDRNGAPRTYDLLATTASAGVGFQRGGTILAADWVDITGSAGPTQLRAGAEQRILGKLLAVRGGFTTAGGYTWGLGVLGVDIAFGKRQPLEVVRTLRF